MALRLLHTADWQIGRIYSQFEPDDAAALFEARFQVVERLAALAHEHAVHAVLVAGDVFDAQTVADKTIRRLFLAMQGYPGPWLLLPGNHDAALAESVWTRAMRLGVVGPNHHLCLDPTPRLIDTRPGAFALLPAPLVQRHTHGDLTEWFASAATPAGLPRIGLAHGCVQGVLPDDIDSANPIAPGRAAQAGLAWLALGDWHGSKRIDERCWYAGTPETDRFRANESGQALLVTLDGPNAPPQVQPLATGRYRWQLIEQTLTVASDLDQTLALLAALGPADVVNLKLSGACDLAAQRRLQQAVDAARARVRALVHEAHALRLQPTEDDIAALHADGYVGEVLQQLRDEQAGTPGQPTAPDRPDPPGSPGQPDERAERAERARDALLILARLLDERGERSERGAPA